MTDAGGNPLSGVTVSFAVSAGGGSVTGASQSTNAGGVATAGGWTLGTIVGENALTAAVSGLPPVVFRAQAAPGDPATLVFTRQPSNATAGVALSPAVSVELRDQYGNLTTNATRTVTIALANNPGGATLIGSLSTATVEGVAQFSDLVLDRSSDGYTLSASAAGLPPATSNSFSIAAGSPAGLSKVLGDNQTATVGTAVPIPPAVRLVDAHGNPIPSRTINFSAGAGGGSVTGETRVTGADGIATVGAWQLGTRTGPQSLFASVAFLPPVLFNATATPGQPVALSKKSVDGQTIAVASGVPLTVQVTDAHGNGVPGVTVTFSVSSGGGSVNPISIPTTELGHAFALWILGTVPGSNSLTASAPGLGSVNFAATTVPGPPVRITKEAGDAQKAPPGSAVAVPPTVRVTDFHGNPTPGVPVTFTVVQGGGQVTGATPTTNALGIASVGSWTLGGSTGPNALKASVSELVSTIFTASSGTLVSGTIQSNTTWSAAESPYQLTGDVKIEYGATLAIEPGVTVIGSVGPNGILRSLELWGALSAVGTAESPIIFRDVRFAGRGMSTGQPHTLVIEHAEILGGSLYPQTNDSYGSIVLRDSKIRNTTDMFNRVTYIHFPSADCYIERNSFFNAQTISTGTAGSTVYITNNAFRATSIKNEFSLSGPKTIVKHNSFLSGLGSMVQLSTDASSDIIAVENWWGTTIESEIEEMIRDKKDDANIPRFIVYSPFLMEPHPLTPKP